HRAGGGCRIRAGEYVQGGGKGRQRQDDVNVVDPVADHPGAQRGTALGRKLGRRGRACPPASMRSACSKNSSPRRQAIRKARAASARPAREAAAISRSTWPNAPWVAVTNAGSR